MKALKLIKLFFRFIVAVIKLMMKLLVVFIVLALILGINASLVMTLILTVLIAVIFINNLFAVMSEGHPCHKRYKKIKPYDSMGDDHWVPGEAAVTPKAFEQGFFHGHDD